MATKRKSAKQVTDNNPDPITGEPGAHPIGTGIGAALGGVAAGAAAGAVGGPVGAVVGAIAGGVGGGLAGKATAEAIDPTAENEYWEQNYPSRPYFSEDFSYDEYQPAYRTGWEARSLYPDAAFDDVEEDVQGHWEKTAPRANSTGNAPVRRCATPGTASANAGSGRLTGICSEVSNSHCARGSYRDPKGRDRVHIGALPRPFFRFSRSSWLRAFLGSEEEPRGDRKRRNGNAAGL